MDTLGTDFDTVLTRGAVLALALAVAWAVLLVAAVALEARSGGRVRLAQRAGCPPAVRLWLLSLFVTLFATAAPAQASDPGPHAGPRSRPGAGPVSVALDGLPLPDRATGGPTSRVSSRIPATGHTVVRAGDSLWRIAREHLPGAATDADVARYVAALYAANRHAIGPDPDLIRPGRHLDFPATTTLPEDS